MPNLESSLENFLWARLARWSAKWFKWRTILAAVSYMILQRRALASTVRSTTAQSSRSSFRMSSMCWRRERRELAMMTMRKKRRRKTSLNGIAKIWPSAIGSPAPTTTRPLKIRAMPFSAGLKANESRSHATSLNMKWTTRASSIASRRYLSPKLQQFWLKLTASASQCASPRRSTTRWSKRSYKEWKRS